MDMAVLAPSPDFRYVGFEPAPSLGARFVAGTLLGGAGVAAGLARALSIGEALFGAVLAASGIAFVWRKIHGPGPLFGPSGVPLAFTPWGVLIEEPDVLHVLRWAAVRRVHLHVVYGRDEATPGALWSLVTVETQRERYTARAPGAVPLESVLANLDAYAEEASHRIAMDLDGAREGEGPVEPDFEPLLDSARAYVESAPASSRLSLPPLGYRRSSARAAGSQTVAELRKILVDRTPRPIDPRPFAAVLAAELHAMDLLRDIVKLVQSPHPFVAAVAKAAAHKLGSGHGEAANVGSLEEVAPFLHESDVAAMNRWCAR
jgi:hypothetical protein